MTERTKRVRWWPAALIVVVAAAAIAWRWWSEAATRQTQVLWTGGVVIVAAVLLALWLLFFSGLSWRARAWTVGVGLVLALAAAASVEHRGFSGDMVPVFGWRFGRPVERSLAPLLETAPHLDFPQFFGPRRDGHVSGAVLVRDWEARPPTELWRLPVGAGWSGFAVVGQDAITLEQRGDEEAVVCYALGNASERWVHAYPARHEHPLGGLGPRTTPTVDGERVFTLGATGVLCALDRRTGEALWQTDVLADVGGTVPEYGMSGSPLVFGDKVIVATGAGGGRSLVAYGAEDGERVWAGGSDGAGYASPMLAQLAGAPQILSFTSSSLTSHEPAGGTVLWSVPWPDRQPNVAQPVVVDDEAVVVSSGYGVGAARYELARDEAGRLAAEEAWSSRAMKAKFAGFVQHDGHLYGLDDGILACVDLERGRRQWKGGRYGHGQLLLAGDVLLVLTEEGEVVLVEATPEEHRELASLAVLDDKTWNPPALAAPYLVVRNDREAVCLSLPLAEPVVSTEELER